MGAQRTFQELVSDMVSSDVELCRLRLSKFV